MSSYYLEELMGWILNIGESRNFPLYGIGSRLDILKFELTW